MNNLYKKIYYNNTEFMIIHEMNHNIALISDSDIIRLNFNTEFDLENFIKKHEVKR